MSLRDDALEMHREHQGKLEITPNIKVTNKEELSLAYSPGVAEPCKEIHENPRKVYEYTIKANTVAVVTDGTAVLGLGNIGAEASIPVMEGKAVLFKSFAGINGVPIALDTTDTDEIINTVKLLQPNYGGINLEDISAPRCFEIEEKLKKETNIPVFHDDQHGTAIVTMAGLINALRIVDKDLSDIKVVLNGAGAAGIAIVKLLHSYGVRDMIMCDSKGAIYEGRPHGMNDTKEYVAKWTNKDKIDGSLKEVIKDADVFIGVSVADLLDEEMVESMADDPIIFAMANPNPEIKPDDAKAAGAKVIGTGRSDYPNQINNVLAFPGIFRGALDVEATHINEDMKKAAVEAIADLIEEDELNPDYCIPGPFDKRVAPSVARSVAKAAMESGVARIEIDPQEVYDKTMKATDLK
ncbi:NAD(P)-dependent malic enzyme [Staphylococcus caprae]|uniref:NAD(P)-dependent malic enzyme n=1 Tax=Staphylococcus caprae TaxID=29380 RepID=UPI000E68DFF3|nr:malic enzyme-like NAD(P)-binding protein [Staphylococcus caprae]MBU5270706.1 NAD-dependent malic enzyme [Staphylococcus caprae]MDK6297651.1 malic enzyme-like NAD(P)-binding protein [Staphylococcus caprae]MDK7233048.1 malic enzyme-like NAD(P)-binding protein [Staphylococcus caprae]RIM34135.1 NAD-dependent malic enzyme [Staphylococcus caprae]